VADPAHIIRKGNQIRDNAGRLKADPAARSEIVVSDCVFSSRAAKLREDTPQRFL
jgi:hypothetical protein